jgi:hypothetical protein
MRKAVVLACLIVTVGATACATTPNNAGIVVGITSMPARAGDKRDWVAVDVTRPTSPGLSVVYVQPVDNPPLAIGERVVPADDRRVVPYREWVVVEAPQR